MTKLIETKILLTEDEDLVLKGLAKADGDRSKTKFCTNVIRNLIKKSAKPAVPYSKEQIDN